MRRLLFLIIITAMGMGQGLSQSLIQTYTDRCTGQTQVFTVPFNGTTVVTFYNRSKTFTYQDFQNGTLRAWLEETYLWWSNLSPCSTTSTGAQATQQTTQQTAQQAASAASNAASSTASNIPNTGTSQSTSTTDSNTGSTGNTGTNSSGEGSNSGEKTEGGSSTEETKSEESSQEEKSNDNKEEESKEEDSESSEEEKEDKKEKEEEEEKKKKRTLAPPIISANMLTQQSPLGGYDIAASFGISQSSLLGDKTYGLNLLAFSDGQQFMLTANYSKVHITNTNLSELTHEDHKHYSNRKKATIKDPKVKPQPRVNRVYSASIGAMKVFTTYLVMMNHSMVWLGKNGSASGVALGTTLTSTELNNDLLLGISATGFYTKPFSVSEKLTVTPMIAISSPFAAVSLADSQGITWNKDIMIIGGPSFTYKLTQRFGLNLGVTLIESTTVGFPTMKSFTLGGRVSF